MNYFLYRLFQETGSGGQETAEDLNVQGGFDIMPAFLTMIGVLAVVVAIIFGVAWLLKRLSGGAISGGPRGLFKMISTFSLGEKRLLVVVKVARRYLLLGVTGDSVRVLKELDPDEIESFTPEKTAQEPVSFASVFSRFTGAGRGDKEE
jgi:flagellar protein FliO/FliZ